MKRRAKRPRSRGPGYRVALRRASLAEWLARVGDLSFSPTLDEVAYDSGLYDLLETDQAARSQALTDLLFLMSGGALRLLVRPCRWVMV